MGHMGVTNGAGAGEAVPGSPGGAKGDETAAAPPLMPSHVLSGKRLVVVGGTGFLGKVWLAMLLATVPGDRAHVPARPAQGRPDAGGALLVADRDLAGLRPDARAATPGPPSRSSCGRRSRPSTGDVGLPLLGPRGAACGSSRARSTRS